MTTRRRATHVFAIAHFVALPGEELRLGPTVPEAECDGIVSEKPRRRRLDSKPRARTRVRAGMCGALLHRGERLIQVFRHEGAAAVLRRTVAHVESTLVELFHIRAYARRPWQGDGRPVFLLVTHRRGGGTERHIQDLASRLRAADVRPVLVRPSSRGLLLWEERDRDGVVHWCSESGLSRQAIASVISLLAPAHAHVHQVMGLPESFPDLLRELRVSYDWTIHDYHTICPRVNLIDASSRYCGEPGPAVCDRCLQALGDDQGQPVSVPIRAWRDRFARHLAGARRVFVPSEDALRRVSAYFPAAPVLLRPHPEPIPEPSPPPAHIRPGEMVHVAVVGRINLAKGSETLLACARDSKDRRLPLEFHVLGSTDRDALFGPLENVRITGPYREADALLRLVELGCHVALVPSVWPETFLYTLSIAMAARLYVVCFDIGAQAERVKAWGWGRVLPLDSAPGAINDALLAAAEWLDLRPIAPPAPQPAVYPDLLCDYYDFTPDELARSGLSAHTQEETRAKAAHSTPGRAHARLY